jgi:hypothetical protein
LPRVTRQEPELSSRTATYSDPDGGNEPARFIRFDFTFENPGDPSMHIVTGADEPNIIYGTSGNGSLTGGD